MMSIKLKHLSSGTDVRKRRRYREALDMFIREKEQRNKELKKHAKDFWRKHECLK